MSRNITLRQLRYFVAAADSGRFSAAATNEHVSQSAITNGVLALETELGVNLFKRLPHGVSLTADGEEFVRHARHILDSVKSATFLPRLRDKALRGKVRIAASYTLLGYFLPELLARFRATYPDVEIDLYDMERAEIQDAILEERVDLGVVILSNITGAKRFGQAVLLRSRRQLWVSPTHPLAQKTSLSLRDITQYPYILLTSDEGERSALQYWRAKGIEPNIGFRTSSIEAVRGLVAHTFGVTILSDMVFRPWSLEGKQIEARPIEDTVPHMDAGIIWHPGQTLSKPAETFQQFMLHAYGH